MAMRKYLVLMRLDDKTDMNRIAECVPPLIEIIQRMSKKPCELVFRSEKPTIFAHIVQTDMSAPMIRAALANAQSSRNTDAILVLEVGEDFSATAGFTRVGAWLQHAQK